MVQEEAHGAGRLMAGGGNEERLKAHETEKEEVGLHTWQMMCVPGFA
jgi:hypothetical protein